MPAASPSVLADLLHAVRARYRLVHVDETQSVLLLYVERLLRAAGCDVLRLRHLGSMAELVVAGRPAAEGPAQGERLDDRLIVAMEYASGGSAARLLKIGAELGATDLWELGWDRVPPRERSERDAADPDKTLPISVQPEILRRSLREAVYEEGREAVARALRQLAARAGEAPERACYIDLQLRGGDPDPRPISAEEALRRWLLFRAAPRSAGAAAGGERERHPTGSPTSSATPRSRQSEPERPIFLLVGAPGSGKSTLLRQFAARLAQEHLAELAAGAALPSVRVPVLVDLSRRPAPEPAAPGGVADLERLLEEAVPGLSGKMLRLWVELGLCVLLLDGPVPLATITRLQQQPTLVGGFPPKVALATRVRYHGDGPNAAGLIEGAVRSGWDLGYLDPLDDERVQEYLRVRIADPMARSAALAQLARSDNLRRLCRRIGLLSALCGAERTPLLLGAGIAEGLPSPPLLQLHAALAPQWLEGVAGERRIERAAREAVARVLARRLLGTHEPALPWWELVPEIGAELPSETDGARLLLHIVRSLDDTMFLVDHGGDAARLRFALPSAADYFAGEDVGNRLTAVPVTEVAACLQCGHRGPVRAVALSESGRLCATGGEDGRVRLWETRGGFLLRTLSGHQDPVTAVLFACEDRLLVSAAPDLTVRLWDPRSGRLQRTLVGHSDGISALGYAPGRELLASGSRDGTVRIWQLGEGQVRCLQTLQVPGPESDAAVAATAVNAVALSPDGLLCAVGTQGPLIQVFHTLSGELLLMLGGHRGPVRALSFSPDGRLLASGGDDLSIRLNAVKTGHLLQSIVGHQQPVRALSFSPDGRLLASGSTDQDGQERQSLRVFELPAPGEHTPASLLSVLRGLEGPACCLAFAPPGRKRPAEPQLLLGGAAGGAQLWRARDGQLLRTLGVPSGSGASIGSIGTVPDAVLGVLALAAGPAAGPDGPLLATGSEDGKIRLWSLRQGRVQRILQGHEGGVLGVAFSPDGQLLASGAVDQTVCLWDLQSGEEVDRFEGHRGEVTTLAFSPDGYLLASGSADRTVRIREVAGGLTVRTFTHGSRVAQLAFTPDGRRLLSATADGRIQVFETTGGPPVQVLRKHLSGANAICVSPDGRLLASAGRDHLVRIWDARTGRPMQALGGHGAAVTAVAFAPDGKLLASAGQDRSVRLWEARSGRAVHTIYAGHAGAGALRALCFAEDGRLLAGGDDGVVAWQVPYGRVLGQLVALPDGWLSLCPVASEAAPLRYGVYAAEPETPAALRISDGMLSYPSSGWERLCQRPTLVSQTLMGGPYPSLPALQEELRAAPRQLPALESSGSGATPMDASAPLALPREDSPGAGRPGRLITADELLTPSAEVRGELAQGAVVPLSPTTYAPGRVSGRLHAYLAMHVLHRNLGDVPSSDTGFLLQRNPDLVRAPDVSYVARERVPQGGGAGFFGFFNGAPDLAAEVVSPANEWEAVERKAQEYLATGARLVWVLDPQTRTVHVHESPVRVRILGEADQLSGDTVLPGFSVPVRDLFG